MSTEINNNSSSLLSNTELSKLYGNLFRYELTSSIMIGGEPLTLSVR